MNITVNKESPNGTVFIIKEQEDYDRLIDHIRIIREKEGLTPFNDPTFAGRMEDFVRLHLQHHTRISATERKAIKALAELIQDLSVSELSVEDYYVTDGRTVRYLGHVLAGYIFCNGDNSMYLEPASHSGKYTPCD